MSNFKLLFIIFMLATLIAGCGTKTQDTKTPASPQIGIIDMNKAIKAHPKYNQLVELGKTADSLAAQLQAQQDAAAKQAELAQASAAQSEMQEISKAFEQEFNAKIAEKQSELNPKLAEKANEAERNATEKFEAYNDQLEKEYQPKLFDLKLKLDTIQSNKEEAASLQAEIDKLQAQHAAALEAKHKQLAAQIEESMAPEKAAAEEEMTAYSKQLNEEMSKKIAAKQAEIAARMSKERLAADSEQAISQTQQQFTMKQQEFQALQGAMIENIKTSTAKIASEEKLDAVFTNITVNVNAVDVTAKVIAECNK